MRTGTIFFISLIVLGFDIAFYVVADYQYSKKYESYWSLAEKASSVPKKLEGIDKFVKALDGSNMQGKYNALFMQTPDNSFDENFQALKSLQLRMHEIQNMDVKSFEYQTALQQITQQEQNEASAMLNVFSGIWMKDNYFLLWGWIGTTQVVIFIILLIIGLFAWADNDFRFRPRY